MPSTTAEQQQDFHQLLSSGKTSLECSAAKITLSEPSLDCLPAKIVNYNHQGSAGQTLVVCFEAKEQSRGGSLMPNISEWPNDADVCLLSQVLEPISIPPKYFLSPMACAGILRRAEARGRQLPELLETALKSAATGITQQTHTQPSTSHTTSEE